MRLPHLIRPPSACESVKYTALYKFFFDLILTQKTVRVPVTGDIMHSPINLNWSFYIIQSFFLISTKSYSDRIDRQTDRRGATLYHHRPIAAKTAAYKKYNVCNLRLNAQIWRISCLWKNHGISNKPTYKNSTNANHVRFAAVFKGPF